MAENADNPLIDVVIEQVFETALLQDGIHPDPASMAERLTALMQAATSSADSVNFAKYAPQRATASENGHEEIAEEANSTDEE